MMTNPITAPDIYSIDEDRMCEALEEQDKLEDDDESRRIRCD